MGNSLCERPDLDLAVGSLIQGRAWNRRRWTYTIPAAAGSAIDTQAGYLRLVPTSAYALQVFSNTTPQTAQTLLVKFRRPVVAGCAVHFWLSSSGDNPGGSLGVQPTNGYGVTVAAGTTTAPVLVKVAAGTSTTLGTSAGVSPTTTNQWYWLRLNRTSTDVQFRIWQDGNAEPSTWDVDAVDSALAAGVLEMSIAAGSGIEVDFQQITLSQTGMSPLALPLTFRDLTGKRIPAGKTTQTVVDDGINATQSASLTGTTTQDAAKWRRIISAAASSSASVSMPATLTGCNAVRATVRELVSSNNQAQGFLGFVNGTNQIGVQQQSNNSGGTATIVLPAADGGNVTSPGFDWMGEAAAGWWPNVTVELNFRNANPGFAGQFLVWAAEDTLLYWVDLTTIAAGAWTPTLTATALSTTAITLEYSQFQVDYESGSDW